MKCKVVLISRPEYKDVIEVSNYLYEDLEKAYGTPMAEGIMKEFANPNYADKDSFASWFWGGYGKNSEDIPTIADVKEWLQKTRLNTAFSYNVLKLPTKTFKASIATQVYHGMMAYLSEYMAESGSLTDTPYEDMFSFIEGLKLDTRHWNHIYSMMQQDLKKKEEEIAEKIAYESSAQRPNARIVSNLKADLSIIQDLNEAINDFPEHFQLEFFEYLRNLGLTTASRGAQRINEDGSIVGKEEDIEDADAPDTSDLQEPDTVLEDSVDQANEEEAPGTFYTQTTTTVNYMDSASFLVKLFFKMFPAKTADHSFVTGELGLPTVIDGYKYMSLMQETLADVTPETEIFLVKLAKKALEIKDVNLMHLINALSVYSYGFIPKLAIEGINTETASAVTQAFPGLNITREGDTLLIPMDNPRSKRTIPEKVKSMLPNQGTREIIYYSDLEYTMHRIIEQKGKLQNVVFTSKEFESKKPFLISFTQQMAKVLMYHYRTIVSEKGEIFSNMNMLLNKARTYENSTIETWRTESLNLKKYQARVKEFKSLALHRLNSAGVEEAFALLGIYTEGISKIFSKKDSSSSYEVFSNPFAYEALERAMDLLRAIQRLPEAEILKLMTPAVLSKNKDIKSHFQAFYEYMSAVDTEYVQRFQSLDVHGNQHQALQLYSFMTRVASEFNNTAFPVIEDEQSTKEPLEKLYDEFQHLFYIDKASLDAGGSPLTEIGKMYNSGYKMQFAYNQEVENNYDGTKKSVKELGPRELIMLDISDFAEGRIAFRRTSERALRPVVTFIPEKTTASRSQRDKESTSYMFSDYFRKGSKTNTVQNFLPQLRLYFKTEVLQRRLLKSEQSAFVGEEVRSRLDKLAVFEEFPEFIQKNKSLFPLLSPADVTDLLNGEYFVSRSGLGSIILEDYNQTTNNDKIKQFNGAIDLFLLEFGTTRINNYLVSMQNAGVYSKYYNPSELKVNSPFVKVKSDFFNDMSVQEMATILSLSYFGFNFEYSHFFESGMLSFKNGKQVLVRTGLQNSPALRTVFVSKNTMLEATNGTTTNEEAQISLARLVDPSEENQAALDKYEQSKADDKAMGLMQSFFQDEVSSMPSSLSLIKSYANINNSYNLSLEGISSVVITDPVFSLKNKSNYSDIKKAVENFRKLIGAKDEPGLYDSFYDNVPYADSVVLVDLNNWFAIVEHEKAIAGEKINRVIAKYRKEGPGSFTKDDLNVMRMTALKMSANFPMATTKNYAVKQEEFATPVASVKAIWMPMIPNLFGKEGFMQRAIDFSQASGVSAIIVESGAKTNKPNLFSFDNFETEWYKSKGTTMAIPFKHLGVQVQIAPKTSKKTRASVQEAKHNTLDMFDAGEFDHKNFGELKHKVDMLPLINAKLTKLHLENLLDVLLEAQEAGVNPDVTSFLYNSSLPLNGLHALLRESLSKSGSSGDITTALDALVLIAKDGYRGAVFLEEFVSGKNVKEAIYSMLEKKVILQKTTGSQVFQMSSLPAEGDVEFKYYRKSPDGKRWLPSQRSIELPSELYKYVALKYGNGVFSQSALDKFNRDIMKDEERFENDGTRAALTEIREMFSLRVPHSAFNLSSVSHVVHFYSPVLSNLAIVPQELVYQDGSDFDGDKTTIYGKNYKIKYNKQSSEIIYIDPLEIITESGELKTLTGPQKSNSLEDLRTMMLNVQMFSDEAYKVREVHIAALENLRVRYLIDIHMHDINIGQMMRPLDTVMWTNEKGTGYLDKIIAAKHSQSILNPSFADVLDLAFNNSITINFQSSQETIGMTASAISTFAIHQRNGNKIPAGFRVESSKTFNNTVLASVDRALNPFRSVEKRNTDFQLGSRLNEVGEIKSDIMNAHLQMVLGGLKELSQYLANTTGKVNSSILLTGIIMNFDVRKIIAILNQPLVRKYIEQRISDRGKMISKEASLIQTLKDYVHNSDFVNKSGKYYGVFAEKLNGPENGWVELVGDSEITLNEMYQSIDYSVIHPDQIRDRDLEVQVNSLLAAHNLWGVSQALLEYMTFLFPHRTYSANSEIKGFQYKKALNASQKLVDKGVIPFQNNPIPVDISTQLMSRKEFYDGVSKYQLTGLPIYRNIHREFMEELSEAFKYNQEQFAAVMRAYSPQLMAYIMTDQVIDTRILGEGNNVSMAIDQLMNKNTASKGTVASEVAQIKQDVNHPLHKNRVIALLMPDMVSDPNYDFISIARNRQIDAQLIKEAALEIKEYYATYQKNKPNLYLALFHVSFLQTMFAKGPYNLLEIFDAEAVQQFTGTFSHYLVEILEKGTEEDKARIQSQLQEFPFKFVMNNLELFQGKTISLQGRVFKVGFKNKSGRIKVNGNYTSLSSKAIKNFDAGLVPIDTKDGIFAVKEADMNKGVEIKNNCK